MDLILDFSQSTQDRTQFNLKQLQSDFDKAVLDAMTRDHVSKDNDALVTGFIVCDIEQVKDKDSCLKVTVFYSNASEGSIVDVPGWSCKKSDTVFIPYSTILEIRVQNCLDYTLDKGHTDDNKLEFVRYIKSGKSKILTDDMGTLHL